MIAALPMYDWPEERDTVDRTWGKIRDVLRLDGIDAPDALTRSEDLHGLWTAPDLVLGQTCGLPYALGLHEHVHLLGALNHDLPQTPAGMYRSAIVVRRGDPRPIGDCFADTIAVNAPDSQSGWGALAHWANGYGDISWGKIVLSGCHRTSAEMVADGRASVAALDIVTFHLLEKHAPEVAGALDVVVQTRRTPALPMICAAAFDPDQIADAITTALGKDALVRYSPDAYFAVPRVPFPAPT